MSTYYKEWPVTITDPDTDEEATAYAWWYFTEGYVGTRTEPPEPPSAELVDVKLCGASVMDFLSSNQLDRIESELLESVLSSAY